MFIKANTKRVSEVRPKFNPPKSHPPGTTLAIQNICADQMCPVAKPSDPTQHQMVSNPFPLPSTEVFCSGCESGMESVGVWGGELCDFCLEQGAAFQKVKVFVFFLFKILASFPRVHHITYAHMQVKKTKQKQKTKHQSLKIWDEQKQ